MDIQFYGANCVRFSNKKASIIVDDTVGELGLKPVANTNDIALFTQVDHKESKGRFTIDSPGEYEISEVSIMGIPATRHIDTDGKLVTMFSIRFGDISVAVVGHVKASLSEEQLESLGIIDVLVVPVGGNGYTLDAIGAMQVIKKIEPKIVIPTYYADNKMTFEVPPAELSVFLQEAGATDVEPVDVLKLKSSDLTDKLQVVVFNRQDAK